MGPRADLGVAFQPSGNVKLTAVCTLGKVPLLESAFVSDININISKATDRAESTYINGKYRLNTRRVWLNLEKFNRE